MAAPVHLTRNGQLRIDLDYLAMTDTTFQDDIWVNLTDVNGTTLTIQRSHLNQLVLAGWLGTASIPTANIVEDGG